MTKRKRSSKNSLIVTIILVIIAAVVLASRQKILPDLNIPGFAQKSSSTFVEPLKDLSVHFIDVGQADSIFVYCDGSTMLIDTGTPDMGSRVENYLKSYHISSLNYLVGTHPHDDHIGGMCNIIDNFKIDKLLMTKAKNNTKTYEDLLKDIAAKNMKVTVPSPGQTFRLGNAECTVLAPNSTYDDLNDMSIVIRLVYKGKSFLFTGDASAPSEADILKKGFTLKSDVLKVGHHGSTSATSPDFLKAVSPQYAVISVGANNTYGHPAPSTLTKLQDAGATVFRTDLNGTVIFDYDGKNLTYKTEK